MVTPQLAVSSALRHAVLQGTLHIPNGCDPSHHLTCAVLYYFCGMLIWPLLGDGRLAMRLPVANYAAGFCVVRERLSKEWSFKMTSFAALPTEMQCDGSAIILAGPTVIMSYSSS